MKENGSWKIIARMESPFPGKFAIPRQSGRVNRIRSKIIFEPEYRNADALRGLEGYSHLWILWQFSEVPDNKWSPTVRPPRLGGNQRVGVFATRSPYRPNPIGLSCVRIEEINFSSPQHGPYIIVSGADLMDGSPIYDIKPYLPSSDCITDAVGGFADVANAHLLEVSDPDGVLSYVPEEVAEMISALLAEDPRPGYQRDAERVYSFECAGYHVSFRVDAGCAILCGMDPLG